MNRISAGLVVMVVAGWAAWASAATRVWDDGGGDHLWTNSVNWTADTKPVAADTASFDETKVGPVVVDTAVTVNTLYWTNRLGGLYDVTIMPGSILSVTNKAYVCFLAYTSNVRLSGGGTFQAGGAAGSEFNVGYRTSSTIGMEGKMVVSNLILRLNKLWNVGVGVNTDAGNQAGNGELDLRDATIVTEDAQTNCFKIAGTLKVGGTKVAGLLRLPPAITNMEAAMVALGPSLTGTSNGIVDLGESPQLQSLVATNALWVYRGRVVWSESGTMKTGMPSAVSVRVGSPDNPGILALGYMAGSSTEVRWGGFKGLETYITNLYLGRQISSGTGPAIGELDLQSTNMTRLAGSIGSNQVDIQRMIIGGPDGAATDGDSTGILRLPRTVSGIAAGDLYLGAHGDASNSSELNLGSNSLLSAFSVSNVFQIGCGSFRYVDAGGNSRTGFPGKVVLKVGVSPSQRGKLIVRQTKAATSPAVYGANGWVRLNGIGRLEAYLSELTVADAVASGVSYAQYGELDLRGCTNMVLDVDGSVGIGAAIGTTATVQPVGHGFVYLPAGTVVIASNLSVGAYRTNAIYGEGVLSLSNTIVMVSNTVTIAHTGLVTNQINGLSSGLDIGTTNFALVASNATSSRMFGRIVLDFQSDPLNATQPYWGLKVAGNVVPDLQALTNDTARFTINKAGLNAPNQLRLGVYYSSSGNFTYVGLEPLPNDSGSVILIR